MCLLVPFQTPLDTLDSGVGITRHVLRTNVVVQSFPVGHVDHDFRLESVAILSFGELWKFRIAISKLFDVGDAGGWRNRNRGSKSTCVIAWFYLLMLTLDRMPDETWVQVSAPDKKSVYGWNMDDVT